MAKAGFQGIFSLLHDSLDQQLMQKTEALKIFHP